LVLQYFQIVFAWPVATVVMVAIAFRVFHADIKSLMSRIARIRFPSGREFTTSQIERSANDPVPAPIPKVPKNDLVPIPQGANYSPEQQKVVEQLLEAERISRYLWEHKYLHYFLAYRTQLVLDWFSTVTAPVSRSLFDSFWISVIPEVEERNAT
jgi:hypothetical protein